MGLTPYYCIIQKRYGIKAARGGEKSLSTSILNDKVMETLSVKKAVQKPRRLSRKNGLRQLNSQLGFSLDTVGLSANEVTFMSQSTKSTAVKKGTGVMIGDYFVGVTTGADFLFSHPMIVY
jgi:hypothetical protein